MKTIAITSIHALISRNILQASVLERLLAAGHRVVLVVPEAKVAFFKEHFNDERVAIHGITVPKRRLEDLMLLIGFGLVGTENHIVRGWKTEGSYVRYGLTVGINKVFSHFFGLQRLVRAFARAYVRSRAFDTLFDTHHPDLVFTTDSFNREDAALLLECERRGTPTVGMIRSWDNATTKGVLLSVPNRMIVTNDVLREEMITIHRIAPDTIAVTGVPHYDMVARPPTVTRDEFCAELGLDPARKIILYAPGGKILYTHDAEILKLFKRFVDDNRFVDPVQFIVRFPPGDTLDTSSVADDAHFILDVPGTRVTARKKENEMSRSDQEHLHNSLAHADIVLTLASTMIIDGTVYNKPVVVFGYDPEPNLPDPISKFTEYVHLKKLLGSGLITVSKSDDEFVRDINEYLKNPSMNQDKRDEVVRRYVRALDGHSGDLVANTVINALGA
jgi:hypothetical protein